MEFLMTYGWAILAAVIAIGVLAYFGVFSPGNYMPEACTLNSPFGCDDYEITTTGVSIVLRNGAGEQVTVDSINVSDCAEDTTGYAMDAGDTQQVDLTCTLTAGAKFSDEITVTYTKSGGTFDHTATGTITGEVG